MTTLIPKYDYGTSGASNRPFNQKLQEVLSPLDFGAIGDGTTDDTAALNAMFAQASGKIVNGLGLTYKVTEDVVIDSYATAGVGYGAGTKFFCIVNANIVENMTIIGNVSFGNSFFGKWKSINSVFIQGSVRFASWYCTYTGVTVTGTSYFGSDLPPTSNSVGFYYNNFDSCILNKVVCDQRYGPVNLNNFRESHWQSWWVKNTGYVGWTVGSYPFKSFHMNTMLGCEAYTDTGTGITAPDGNVYSMVIGDTLGNGVNSGGGNNIYSLYNESTINGLYGDSWVINTIHSSGNSVNFGNNQIGYNSYLTGEPAFTEITRTIPTLYPLGNIASGGDWSILNNSGFPYCLLSSNATPSVITDSTEPTGLGKCVQFTTSIAFGTVSINYSSNSSNGVVSYAILYKVISGSPLIEVTNEGGSGILNGSNSNTLLANGWILAYGKSFGNLIRFNSSSAYSINISAVAVGRGNGVISPVTNVSKSAIAYGTAAPTTATWSVGDVVYNTNPTSGDYVGWVCTVAGTPGTWKTFGAIS